MKSAFRIAFGTIVSLMLLGKSSAQQRSVVGAPARQQYTGGLRPTPVRETVDPKDPVERFIMLAPIGPLVIELSVFIDGEPFNVAREKLIGQMLQLADTGGDGKATWREAWDNPRFGFSDNRPFDEARNDTALQEWIARYDGNQDGLADRVEMRRYLAATSGGPAFTVGLGMVMAAEKSAIRRWLDTDHDQTLSPAELAGAAGRLAELDANANELLTENELGISVVPGTSRAAAGIRPKPPIMFLMGPVAEWDSLFAALLRQYGDAEEEQSLPLRWPDLMSLDANKDGRLDQEEIARFNTIKPHLVVEARVGRVGSQQPRLSVSAAPELKPQGKIAVVSGDRTIIPLPGMKLDVSVRPLTRNYALAAQMQLSQWDSNKNKYLELSEVINRSYARQLKQWDSDGDGKLSLAELSALIQHDEVPRASRITATASTAADPLLATLDTSGDRRLGVREIKQAAARLATLDKNGDGAISPDEIDDQVSLVLAHGGLPYPGDAVIVLAPGPEWFTRMDRNADGDIGPREFIGSPVDFKRIDTDGDGLIDVNEARAAGN